MLFTEVRPLSRLPDVFLLSQGPIQDTTWHLVIVAPSAPLGCDRVSDLAYS